MIDYSTSTVRPETAVVHYNRTPRRPPSVGNPSLNFFLVAKITIKQWSTVGWHPAWYSLYSRGDLYTVFFFQPRNTGGCLLASTVCSFFFFHLWNNSPATPYLLSCTTTAGSTGRMSHPSWGCRIDRNAGGICCTAISSTTSINISTNGMYYSCCCFVRGYSKSGCLVFVCNLPSYCCSVSTCLKYVEIVFYSRTACRRRVRRSGSQLFLYVVAF